MGKILFFFVLAEGSLLLLFNVLYPEFPKLPWDINLEKVGIRVKIPFISGIVLAAIFYLLFGNRPAGIPLFP